MCKYGQKVTGSQRRTGRERETPRARPFFFYVGGLEPAVAGAWKREGGETWRLGRNAMRASRGLGGEKGEKTVGKQRQQLKTIQVTVLRRKLWTLDHIFT
jgi:hypothetical protein